MRFRLSELLTPLAEPILRNNASSDFGVDMMSLYVVEDGKVEFMFQGLSKDWQEDRTL